MSSGWNVFSNYHTFNDRKKNAKGREKKLLRWWIDSCRSCISFDGCQNEWVKIKRPKFDEWKKIHFSFCQLVSAFKKSIFSIPIGVVFCTIAQFFFVWKCATHFNRWDAKTIYRSIANNIFFFVFENINKFQRVWKYVWHLFWRWMHGMGFD